MAATARIASPERVGRTSHPLFAAGLPPHLGPDEVARWQRLQRLECAGRLAVGVGHEFNNALAVIAGFAELLASRCSPDDIQSEVAELRRAVERASTLAQQLMSFGRGTPVAPQPIDLGLTVQRMQYALGCVTRARVALAIQAEVGLGLVPIHPTEVEQVLLNLVLNACDAIPAHGGQIRVVVEAAEVTTERAHRHGRLPAGRYVRLSVSDTGSGMDEETHRRLFEAFYTTKSPGKGTGLGLAIVWEVVTRTGGQILVETALGKGTCVEMYWPRAIPGER